MIRRPPRSTLFPLHDALPISDDGFELERVRFMAPIPLADAFEKVEAHLNAIGRPCTAFAHCELRSPAPFNDQRSEEHTSELQSRQSLVCRLLLAKKKYTNANI